MSDNGGAGNAGTPSAEPFADGESYAIRFLGGELGTSLVDEAGDQLRVPTAPAELHALLTLALKAGRPVAVGTLAEVVYGSSNSTNRKNLQSPLARLRSRAWPITQRTIKLDVSPRAVDILDFDARAKEFIDRCHGPAHTPEFRAQLLQQGLELDHLWATDPAEPYRDHAQVAELFAVFEDRRERFVAALEDLRARHSIELEAPAVAATFRELRGAYLKDVVRRGTTLAFGDPTSWTVDRHSAAGVTLEDVWTPLRVADSKTRSGKTGTHESMAEGGEGDSLLELIRDSSEPVVLLGEPGGGKSTSVAMLAVNAARSTEHALPIWVNLGAAIPDSHVDAERLLLTGVPEIGLAIARGGRQAGYELETLLESAITNGDAFLLLDGLDEVKEHALDAVRSAISDIVRAPAKSATVVTCREFDYRLAQPLRKVPIARELEILPFNAEEKATYVERWYEAAARAGGFNPALATRLSDALRQELRDTPAISEMAELPLLLALLTLIHSRQELPDSRSVVCDQAVKFMLAEAPPWRGREPGASVEASGPIIRLAVEVAFRSHSEEEVRSTERTGITSEAIEVEAEKIHQTLLKAGAGRGLPSADDLAKQFKNSHGLLLKTGPARYRFAHRYFQEFLAGQHYARGADREEAVARGASHHWREPFRLMANFAGHNEGQNLFYILQLIRDLLDQDRSIASSHLAAEMLTEITRPRLALWDFGQVLEEVDGSKDGHDGVAGLWARARDCISTHIEDARLSLPERERAGRVLGLLGDRRFVDENGGARGAWSNLVAVRGGWSRVGTDRLNPVTMTGGFVASPRRLRFKSFLIGTYPVTNAEFAGFVGSDGYACLDYWQSPLARGWVSGDPVALDEIKQHWLRTVYEHHAKEIRDKEIQEAKLEEEADRRTAPRTEPYYWGDRRFNQANQPVVGVNFWEAEAFCRWATAHAHREGALPNNKVLRLPTEFEWEHASRPIDDDRIFPWGDHWDEQRAHVTTNTLNKRQPAPVGIHLEPWAGGPRDMAGNVWEWTASLFFPYDAEYDSRRLDSNSLDERVVRGCSWYNFSHLASCSARAVDRSYNLFYDVGFRVAVVDRDAPRAGST